MNFSTLQFYMQNYFSCKTVDLQQYISYISIYKSLCENCDKTESGKSDVTPLNNEFCHIWTAT
jgi:hypothetical protein